ncbi:MAG: hypothetical protein ACK5JT_17035 [Hyphomicrobiaceae bacterium]
MRKQDTIGAIESVKEMVAPANHGERCAAGVERSEAMHNSTLEYIADMLSELAKLAKKTNCATLSELLELSRREALRKATVQAG